MVPDFPNGKRRREEPPRRSVANQDNNTTPSLRPPSSVHVLPSRLGARVSGGENRRQSSLRLRGLFLHESVEKVLLVARELWLLFR